MRTAAFRRADGARRGSGLCVAARIAMAELAARRREPGRRSLARRAERLRAAVRGRVLDARHGFYAIALDGGEPRAGFTPRTPAICLFRGLPSPSAPAKWSSASVVARSQAGACARSRTASRATTRCRITMDRSGRTTLPFAPPAWRSTATSARLRSCSASSSTPHRASTHGCPSSTAASGAAPANRSSAIRSHACRRRGRRARRSWRCRRASASPSTRSRARCASTGPRSRARSSAWPYAGFRSASPASISCFSGRRARVVASAERVPGDVKVTVSL